jgi:hypothetical protein
VEDRRLGCRTTQLPVRVIVMEEDRGSKAF